MDKKNETTKPILNHKRRQLLIGAALTPVVMTLHSAKVYADGILDTRQGVSGAAPYSGAIRGSAGMENSGGTIETENALYSAICNGEESPHGPALADYYGSFGQNGSEPTQLSDFLGWTASETNSFRWQYSSSTGRVNWTQRYEAMLVDAIDKYVTSETMVANITTLNSATWKSDDVNAAYEAIIGSAPQAYDWTNAPFTVTGTEGVRAYFSDIPSKLQACATAKYNTLSSTQPDPQGE